MSISSKGPLHSSIGGELEDIENELKVVANGLTKQASVGTLESFIYDKFEALLNGIKGVDDFVRPLYVYHNSFGHTFPFIIQMNWLVWQRVRCKKRNVEWNGMWNGT